MAEPGGAIPSLLVTDLAATLAFYERLGFAVRGRSDHDGGQWAEVRRGGATLQFFTEAPEGLPTSPVMSGTLYFRAEDVDALAGEWRGKVAFAWGPEVMDYGMREVAVRDPNGYLIAFTEPVERA